MKFVIVDTFNNQKVGEPFEAKDQAEADKTLGPVPRNEGFEIRPVEPAKKKIPDRKEYKIRGSHRTEREVKQILDKDPDIHSGNAGKGAFCVWVTVEEHKILKEAGIKIKNKPE